MIEVSFLRDLVAIAGVFIGLTYYIMNIQETRRNRRITLTTTVLEPFMTVEGNQMFMDLMSMTWNDHDDYMNKYDHRVNQLNFAQRSSMWNRCNAIGSLYREGLLDLKTLYVVASTRIIWLWFKFKPIIEKYRGADFDVTAYEDWEYLAEKLLEYLDSLGERQEYLGRLIENPGTTT